MDNIQLKKRLFLSLWAYRLGLHDFKARFGMWLAFRLPRWLVYFATLRALAHSTSGKYGATVVDDITPMDMLIRWEERE